MKRQSFFGGDSTTVYFCIGTKSYKREIVRPLFKEMKEAGITEKSRSGFRTKAAAEAHLKKPLFDAFREKLVVTEYVNL